MDVVLDVSSARAAWPSTAKLSFADNKDLELTTEWIYSYSGRLPIGTEAGPHTRNATITLTNNVPGEDVMRKWVTAGSCSWAEP